jgi:hypothetical protein
MARAIRTEPPLTLFQLQQYYRDFNRRAFNSQLPDKLPIKFVNSTQYGGRALCKYTTQGNAPSWNKTRGAKIDYSSLAIEISVAMLHTHEQMLGVLLHEMIHIYFLITGELGENHGEKFHAMMKTVGNITGIEVPETDAAPVAQYKQVVVGVVVIEMPNKYLFAIISNNAVTAGLKDYLLAKSMSTIKSYPTSVYLSNSIITQQMSNATSIQRKLDRKTRFFSLKDAKSAIEWIDDLKQNAKLVASI